MNKNKAIRVASPLVSILLACLTGSLLILAIGENPLSAFSLIFKGAFGSLANFATTTSKMTTLTLTGLSYSFAYRCGLSNIGAEGQMYAGALCSTLVVLYMPGPAALVILVAIVAGFIGGGLCGLLIGVLKVAFGANEVITTVMLNYVMQYLVLYMVAGPIQDPNSTAPQTMMFDEKYWLPWLNESAKLHCGIILMVLSLVFYGVFLWKMRAGFGMRVVGQNNAAAEYAGLNVRTNRLLAMFLAGGFAGLAGAIEVLGVQHRLLKGVASNYGFDGMAVALLGGTAPVGMFLGGILIGALKSGGNSLQMFSKIPSSAVDLIRAMVIIFVLVDVVARVAAARNEKRRMMIHE